MDLLCSKVLVVEQFDNRPVVAAAEEVFKDHPDRDFIVRSLHFFSLATVSAAEIRYAILLQQFMCWDLDECEQLPNRTMAIARIGWTEVSTLPASSWWLPLLKSVYADVCKTWELGKAVGDSISTWEL